MKQKGFKHWIVLAICCGLAAASIGISINTSGVFYSAVCEDLNILRGNFSLHMTIFSLVTAFFSLVVPKLYDKIPFKLLLTISVAIAVVSTGMMALGTNVLYFYIIAAIRGMSTCVFSSVCLTMIINQWFIEKNGLCTSIVFAFTGLSGSIFSPILTSCINSFGWKMSYIIMAVLILVLCLPAILYPFHIDPKKDNLFAYGYKETNENSILTQEDEVKKYSFMNISFIMLFIFAVLMTSLTSFTQHFPGYVESIGFSAALGATLLSAGMMGNVLSKLVIGTLSDYIGRIQSVLIMMAVNLIGLLLILTGSSPIILIAGAFMFGSCYSICAVGLVLLTRQFFGPKNYSQTYPVITLASNLGSAVSLPIIGYVYDIFGSYSYALMMALVIIAVCLACLFISYKSSKTVKE